jgi:hypothetical protein
VNTIDGDEPLLGIILDPENQLDAALIRFGRTIHAL